MALEATRPQEELGPEWQAQDLDAVKSEARAAIRGRACAFQQGSQAISGCLSHVQVKTRRDIARQPSEFWHSLSQWLAHSDVPGLQRVTHVVLGPGEVGRVVSRLRGKTDIAVLMRHVDRLEERLAELEARQATQETDWATIEASLLEEMGVASREELLESERPDEAKRVVDELLASFTDEMRERLLGED